jgi:hypothetical protein
VGEEEHSFGEIEETFKRTVATLDAAEVPFLLGGSLASWARGGPRTHNDLDFMVRPQDAERALEALADAGMRPERPSEDWLLKAWDGEVLVDLIYRPKGLEIGDAVLARGEMLDVAAMRVRVMALEDVLTSKLLTLGEHTLDFESPLQIVRSLREQIDLDQVRARTSDSPYARAFFGLLEELGVVDRTAPTAVPGSARVRVVE